VGSSEALRGLPTSNALLAQELPGLLLAQSRSFVTSLKVEFSEGVPASKVSSTQRRTACAATGPGAPARQPPVSAAQGKESTSLLDEWKGKKVATESALGLLQTYKDLGDSKAEVRFAGASPRPAAMALYASVHTR
jgi:hypothetical protein